MDEGPSTHGSEHANDLIDSTALKTPYVTGGPLGAYKYRLYKIHIHMGGEDRSLNAPRPPRRHGSEHTVDGEHFAGEVQLLAYNEAFGNWTEALKKPRGVVAIAVMVDVRPFNVHATVVIWSMDRWPAPRRPR